MNKQEFISKIKAKYPSYQEVDDNVLFDKIITKYPQYKEQITSDQPKQEGNLLTDISDFFKDSINPMGKFERIAKLSPEERKSEGQRKFGSAITATELGLGFVPGVSSVTQGVGEGARALVQGQDIKTAAKKALMAASLDAALGGIGKYAGFAKKIPVVGGVAEKALAGGVGGMVTGAVKGTAKIGAQMARNIPSWAMNQAIKNPDDVLLKPVKASIDVGSDILASVKPYKQMAGKELQEGIESLASKATKPVDTAGIKEITKKFKLNDDNLAYLSSVLKGQSKKQSIGISDNVIDAFFAGKPISFDDASQLNSLLHGTLDEMGSAFGKVELTGKTAGYLGAVKSNLLTNMDNVAPGVKAVQKIYATKVSKAQKVIDALATKGEPSQSKIRLVSEQLAGKNANKALESRALLEFEKEINLPLTEQLKNSIARETFEKTADSFLGYKTPQALVGALAGGTYGYKQGGIGGAALGALGGGVGATVMGRALSPEMMGLGIKAGNKIPQALRLGTTPLRVLADQLAAEQIK